jgi:hypothetical protein
LKRLVCTARGRNALAHRGGWFALARARKLLVVDARHVDVDVDAVKQWPADALLVARDDVGRASAVLL